MYDPSKPHNNVLREQAARTHHTKHVVVKDGAFARRFPIQPLFEIDHTDGIGSKGILHWSQRTFRNAVLDALAMNLNDLQMLRAIPYKLQNHIFLPEEDGDAITAIATALADECVARDICITGGECAIHDDLKGMEISITMSGFIEDHKRDNCFDLGDVLIGLASTGFHSNGFSYLRFLMREHGLQFRDEWLTPTRIYHLPDWSAIKGIQHITGGGFTKLKQHLKGTDAYIHRRHQLAPQEMYKDVYKLLYSDERMYKFFNCGIGMVLSVEPKDVEKVLRIVGGEVIGEVKKGRTTGGNVFIESMFSNSGIML